MSEVHLTEQQLQDYALGIATDKATTMHIAACSHCAIQVKAYQMLAADMPEIESPMLDFATEQLILNQMPDYGAKKEKRYLYVILFAALVIIAGGLIAGWGMISWIFTGIIPVALITVVILSVILALQLIEVYKRYQQKMESIAATSF